MTGHGEWTEEYFLGVDEAGRGPLAGPVAVAISCIPKPHSRAVFSFLKRAGLDDSKRVKEAAREDLFKKISQLQKEGRLRFEVALVPAGVISARGISHAIQKGIARCLKRLGTQGHERNAILEMDGALRIPDGSWKRAGVIIRGDSIKPSIMIASIVAKVTRDRHMKRLAKKHPQYGFEIHKGYGTRRHRDAVRLHGECVEHRRGWCKA